MQKSKSETIEKYKSPRKRLEDLYCSEIIKYSSEEKISSTPISRIVERSEIFEDISPIYNVKSKSDIGDNEINEEKSRSKEPIKDVTKSQLNSSKSIDQNEKEETFLDWIEKSLEISLKLLDDEIKSIEEESMESCKEIFLKKCDEEDFEGFGEDDSAKKAVSARLQFLKVLRNHSKEASLRTSNFRVGNNQFLREIWKRDMMCSESRFRSINNTGDTTYVDTEEELPKLHFDNSTPRVTTRSSGSAIVVPHVQPKILEYKRNK